MPGAKLISIYVGDFNHLMSKAKYDVSCIYIIKYIIHYTNTLYTQLEKQCSGYHNMMNKIYLYIHTMAYSK